MANNFLNQLQMVVDTGKLQGVTNIKDLYEHFKDSGISYKDFKKQMHDYGIYGHLGKNDMARLSGMYYGSKKADWEAKKPQDLARVEKRTFSSTPNTTIPDNLALLNTPVIQKTASNVITVDPNSGPIYASDTTAAWRDYSTGTDQNPRLVAGNGNGPGTGYSRQDRRGIGPDNTPIYTNNYGQSYLIGSNGQPFNGQLDAETIDRLGLNYYAIPSVSSTINKQNSEYGEGFDDLTGRQQQDFFNWRKMHGGKGTVEEYLKSTKPGGSVKKLNPVIMVKDFIESRNSSGPLYTGVGRTTQSFQQGGRMNKFQQGGQVQQQQQMEQIFTMIDQQPEEAIKILQQQYKVTPEQIMQIVQAGEQEGKIRSEVAQAIYQMFTKAASHGTKLNYLKSLKHQCADDEELVYFKKGGKVNCGCVKKNQEGGKTPKKESPVMKFKKTIKSKDQAVKDSTKLDPKTTKTLPNGKYPSNWTADDKIIWEREHGPKDEGAHTAREQKCGGKIKKDCGGSKMKFEKGDKVKSAGAGCIAKFKMHKQGGSLNGIPFIRKEKIY